jgi:hypothetical protein
MIMLCRVYWHVCKTVTASVLVISRLTIILVWIASAQALRLAHSKALKAVSPGDSDDPGPAASKQ